MHGYNVCDRLQKTPLQWGKEDGYSETQCTSCMIS